jgi:Right handed beta helix region
MYCTSIPDRPTGKIHKEESMLRKAQMLMMLGGVLVLLSAQSMAGANVAVGNCLPAYPHFTTIQAAINASPLGGTVLVCPGTYAEQLLIYHPLTLKGVDNNGSNLVLITMPPGGTGNQIYVQATNVNISDITVDGSNNGVTACGQGPTGIYYWLSSGTINHVAVRNHFPSTEITDCLSGDGIFVGTDNTGASNVTIENSSIHAFQANGIEVRGRGASAIITKNSIGGNVPGLSGNGIAVWFGGSGTITGNSIINVLEPISFPNFFNAGYGIIVQCSQGVTASSNTIGDTQAGIVVFSGSNCPSLGYGNGDGNTFLKNTISQTHIFDAFYVCGNYNLVQGNIINSTSEAAVRIDDSCNVGTSGFFNTVSGNTVNEACSTTLVDPAVVGSNTIGSNTTFNVAFDQLVGTVLPAGECSAAGAPAVVGRGPSVRTQRLTTAR